MFCETGRLEDLSIGEHQLIITNGAVLMNNYMNNFINSIGLNTYTTISLTFTREISVHTQIIFAIFQFENGNIGSSSWNGGDMIVANR